MSAATVLAAGSYALVPDRCEVRFTARSLGLAVPGSMPVRHGTVTVDGAGTAVTAVLDAAGFRTRSDRRDRDVRSARFLDVEQHPEIRFTGRLDGAVLAGELQVKGVADRLELEVVDVVPTDGAAGGARVRARGRLDRRPFPVGPRVGPIGRHLDLELEVELAALPG